jgi:hypothetical protein
VNVGLYRHQVQHADQLGVWFIKGHHGAYIQQKYENAGRDMPVAIVIGHHPGVVMGAVSRLPGFGGEYEEAGALIQEPIELIKLLMFIPPDVEALTDMESQLRRTGQLLHGLDRSLRRQQIAKSVLVLFLLAWCAASLRA